MDKKKGDHMKTKGGGKIIVKWIRNGRKDKYQRRRKRRVRRREMDKKRRKVKIKRGGKLFKNRNWLGKKKKRSREEEKER